MLGNEDEREGEGEGEQGAGDTVDPREVTTWTAEEIDAWTSGTNGCASLTLEDLKFMPPLPVHAFTDC
jgi:hypothetical protein